MMERLARVVSRDWPRFVIELIIVVSGISISFWFQDWRESTRSRSEELRLLQTIEANLKVDEVTLGRFLEMLETGREQLTGLLTRGALEGKELDVAMDQAISYANFTPMTVGWKELEQAGGARLIRDKELLGELILLHGQWYGACAEWRLINRDFILQRMIPYVDEHAPFVDGAFEGGIAGGMGAIHEALVDEVQFRNLIRTNRIFREGQRTVYSIAAEKLAEVQKRVKAAIEAAK